MFARTAVAQATEKPAAADRIHVWDPLVRLFHWSLVAGFATAYLVEDDWLSLHVWAGYLVLALIAVRLVWGFAGPRHARFSDFVRGPRQIGRYFADTFQGRAPRYLGHNPAGGAMIVLLLTAVAATGITGLALYGAQELAGPLAPLTRDWPAAWGHNLEEVHEVLANLTLGLILLHLAGVIASSLLHRENLVRAMITGDKRRDPE
ncbi:cytochrome b/b6 domain-containing protein [Thioalkalicoccus limnaeus]|uniref:Cytochrome b/b6 domain-containing protein n=1 Tax=Thioalkalicoccus limnaeus TaxID=120681 RepID=A0ABV4BEH3_9GAMM